MNPLTKVRVAATKAVYAAQNRDDEIRKAHEQGETIRAIAQVAGLSPARVHQILHGR